MRKPLAEPVKKVNMDLPTRLLDWIDRVRAVTGEEKAQVYRRAMETGLRAEHPDKETA